MGDHKAFAGTRGYPHNMYAGAGRVWSCHCGCGAGADEKSLPAVISGTYACMVLCVLCNRYYPVAEALSTISERSEDIVDND